MLYLGPLVQSALDNPRSIAEQLRSALGELARVSNKCHVIFTVCITTFDPRLTVNSQRSVSRCSFVEAVRVRSSVAQEPGSGAVDRGGGL